MFKLTISLVITLLFQYSNAERKTYKGAVVEISPKLDGATPTEIILDNKNEYIRYIREAAEKRVDIIVFPEAGLQGWHLIGPETIDELSTELPKPEDNIIPFEVQDNKSYSIVLRELSHAAQMRKIYVVVNLIEKDCVTKTSNKCNYYNANVAFDRKGAMIAKYRKINLFGEAHSRSGDKNQLSTFKTDFGVTFGMFICFDVVFEKPALDILKSSGVTDIVYSTAWFTSLPFYSALSVHHGYAVSNGVNFLASGLNNPNETNGGSGIFLADGKIAKAFVTGIHKSALIIENIPIIESPTPHASCENPISTTNRALYKENQYQYLDSFVSITFDKSLYSHKPVDLENGTVSETICSGNNYFCCSFEIDIDRNYNTSMNYRYKLIAFHGSESVSLEEQQNLSIGLRVCGLVTCLNDSISTCGVRDGINPTVSFERISVKAVTKSTHAHDQPSTLNFDLKPLIGYKYCVKKLNEHEVEVNVTTTERQDSVLTFGILGRVYGNDNKPVGIITTNSASFNFISYFNVIIVSIIVFLLQE